MGNNTRTRSKNDRRFQLVTILPKPHLLYVLPYLEQGGTEKQVLTLIDHFRRIYQVSLLAPMGSTSYQFEDLGIAYWQFSRWDFDFWQGIQALIQNIKIIQQDYPINLVHVHGSHELMAVVKLCLPSIPVLFTVHGYHGGAKDFSYWLSSQMANLFADRVIAVCQAEADILRRYGLNQKKVTVIYNGVKQQNIDTDRCQVLRHKFNIFPEEIIIGTVARLSPDKGVIYLLKALALLKSKYNNLHLVIAGNGAQKEILEQLTDTLELHQNVTFVGYLDRLGDLINLFDIFVLPSLQEAFSLATLEAMALAKPIVATTVGGFREQVQDGISGFLVPPTSVSGLVEALEILIACPQKRCQMGQAALVYYQQNFTIDRMFNQTGAIYKDLCFNSK